MYLKTLMSQWENLYNDFSGEYDIVRRKADPLKSFQKWYQTRIHRWSSAAYSEGVILGQQGNQEFRKELLQVLSQFSFSRIQEEQLPPFWISPAAGLIADIMLTAALLVFQYKLLMAMMIGLIVLIIVTVTCSRWLNGKKKKEDQRVQAGYVNQLRSYWNELENVCRRHGVD